MPASPLKIFAVFTVTLVLALWLLQQTVEQYWQQAYHCASPLSALQRFSAWRYGNTLKIRITGFLNLPDNDGQMPNNLTAAVPETTIANHATPPPAKNKHQVQTEKPAQIFTATGTTAANLIKDRTVLPVLPNTTHTVFPAASVPDFLPIFPVRFYQKMPATRPSAAMTGFLSLLQSPLSIRSAVISDESDKVPELSDNRRDDTDKTAAVPPVPVLHQGDRVLFAGDSMMQSLAPHIQRQLSRQKIKSINLGKPSSGLRFPDYYNWPQSIADILNQYPDIHLIVMLLGANDPWDIADPDNKNHILTFSSSGWENFYRGEIQKIFTVAGEHQVQILWIGPPLMRTKKYSTKIAYIDGLIADETVKNHQYYQDTARYFADKNGNYSKYFSDVNGQKTAVRRADGIHFNNNGEKILTRLILQRIMIKP